MHTYTYMYIIWDFKCECNSRAQLLTRDLLRLPPSRNYSRRYIRHYLAKYRARFNISPYVNTCQGFRVSCFFRQKLLHCTSRNAPMNWKIKKHFYREGHIASVRFILNFSNTIIFACSVPIIVFWLAELKFGKVRIRYKCKSAFSSKFLH